MASPSSWHEEQTAAVGLILTSLAGSVSMVAGPVLRRLFVEPASSVEAAVAECLAEYGPGATIAVIPKGTYVMAEVG